MRRWAQKQAFCVPREKLVLASVLLPLAVDTAAVCYYAVLRCVLVSLVLAAHACVLGHNLCALSELWLTEARELPPSGTQPQRITRGPG